jgi:hypothetical protein
MRVVRFLLRFFGWLLTPFVAWAASFLGALTTAAIVPDRTPALRELIYTVAGGGTFAAIVLALWLRLLRRSKRLRTTLQVTEEGTPVAAIEPSAEETP